jgi:ABC-2 type transport system permease protein
MNRNKRKDILGLVIGLGIILTLNFIGSFIFQRFDLTSENRYSLTEPTKELISNLEDQVFIKVYLEGNFPASFKRLRNEAKEMLDEFQAYSNGMVDFEFINPSANPDIKVRDRIYKNLYDKGLVPTDLEINDDDGVSKKIVWPGAIATYQGIETPIQLLKSQFGAAPEIILNRSIESLEFEIASSIKKITSPYIERIAFIEGHGELNKFETADVIRSLRDFYEVERIRLDGNINALSGRRYPDSTNTNVINQFVAAVIAGPDSSFSEKDKFIIDQFAMHGGKIIWLIDKVEASMDSLGGGPGKDFSMAVPKDLNLGDQLFKYGVRINADLVQDLRAAPISVVSGQFGNQVKTKLYPWIYFPMLFSKNDHPINKNLDVIKTEFTNSIDLVGNDQLKKTVILSTSDYTKLVKAPSRISLNILSYEPPQEQFTKKNVPIAVLVEGKFESVFKNRLTPQMKNASEIQFKERSEETKMIFISDGDFIKNKYNQKTNEYFALGFDRNTNQTFANKDFFMNSVNYLVDESGLILSNTKSFKIRLLDAQKINNNKSLIQILNTVLPIIIIILIGLILNFIRKRKYTVK